MNFDFKFVEHDKFDLQDNLQVEFPQILKKLTLFVLLKIIQTFYLFPLSTQAVVNMVIVRWKYVGCAVL